MHAHKPMVMNGGSFDGSIQTETDSIHGIVNSLRLSDVYMRR